MLFKQNLNPVLSSLNINSSDPVVELKSGRSNTMDLKMPRSSLDISSIKTPVSEYTSRQDPSKLDFNLLYNFNSSTSANDISKSIGNGLAFVFCSILDLLSMQLNSFINSRPYSKDVHAKLSSDIKITDDLEFASVELTPLSGGFGVGTNSVSGNKNVSIEISCSSEFYQYSNTFKVLNINTNLIGKFLYFLNLNYFRFFKK